MFCKFLLKLLVLVGIIKAMWLYFYYEVNYHNTNQTAQKELIAKFIRSEPEERYGFLPKLNKFMK